MWLKRLIGHSTGREQQTSQPQTVTEPTSHEVVYGEIKSRLDAQRSNIGDLNTKANALIGFGGAILAILLGTQASWLALSEIPKTLAVLGGTLLIFSVVFAYRGYNLQSYRADPEPRSLAERYRYKPISETREMLMANLVDGFEFNEKVIKTRVRQIRYSFRLQLLAIILLGLATLLGILRDAKVL
jgi:hypothetical protein